MTRTVLIAYSLIVFTMSSCKETPNEKYFENTLVNAFKHQDFGEFRKIIITPEDLESGLASNSKSSSDDRNLIEDYRRTYIMDYKTLFDQIIKQGESLSIDWTRITFDSFLYHINDPIIGSGLHLMNCHINIKIGEKNYVFYGIDAQEYRTGYYKVSFIKAIKRGRLQKYIDSNNSPEPEL